MTEARYQELLMNNNVFPLGSDSKVLLLSPSGTMLIEVSCISINSFIEFHKELKSRVLLFVYPSSCRPEGLRVMPTYKSKSLIMVDCEDSNSAFTYQLTIDEVNMTADLKLCDMPEHGKLFLTEKDIIGTSKKMWSQNVPESNRPLPVYSTQS